MTTALTPWAMAWLTQAATPGGAKPASQPSTLIPTWPPASCRPFSTVWKAGIFSEIAGFAPPINYDVSAVVATNTTVYAGGAFQGVGSQDRGNLAAFNASNGALLNWAPQATGGYVWSMAINPQGTKIVAGGSFTALNGSSNPGYGLGMLDATTGANLPMAVNNFVRNGVR